MRATAQDRDAAAMMGIDVNRTISFTFMIAGALAGAAGLLYALYFGQVRYDTGFQLGLIAFTAAVLGGIGNLPGAVLGALCIGFIQAFNEGLRWHSPGSDWTQSIVFSILILILVFRPEGLLGERTPKAPDVGRRIARRRSPAAGGPCSAPSGCSRDRWQALPRQTRRTVKAVVWVVIGLLLIAGLGVWKNSALAMAAVVLLLVLPSYRNVRRRRAQHRQVDHPRRGARARDRVPVLHGPPAAGADLRAVPADEHDGRDDDLHDHGPRPELRRRLRGTARPRLRRLLRDGRVHGGLVRVEPVRESEPQPRRRRPLQGRHGLPLLDLARAAHGGTRDRASSAC